MIQNIRLMSGNEAIARGLLEAGVNVVAGYPGTPSSEVIDTLLHDYKEYLDRVYVEWSVNEKVAAELAIAAAWAGLRAAATMKMSGMNVASDSFLSAVYSGVKGGLVFYVADDPGVYAGMVEQDTRNYAVMAPCPVIEPRRPKEAKNFVSLAFNISEEFKIPIILRGTTVLAHSEEPVPLGEIRIKKREFAFEKDIAKYTKAGRKIVLEQHKETLNKIKKIKEAIYKRKYYDTIGNGSEILIITAGNASNYVLDLMNDLKEKIKVLRLWFPWPIPEKLIEEHVEGFTKILIVEEIDPIIEREVRAILQEIGSKAKVFGKLFGGPIPGYNEMTPEIVSNALAALGLEVRAKNPSSNVQGFRRPITFCPGCPHRVTYFALVEAMKSLGLDSSEIIITGDIGCTILAMNKPFEIIWTELSMGASVGLARGFLKAGKDIVIATVGDSTFFHATIPQIINAYLTNDNVKVIILDNSWVAMTGHQPTPTSPITKRRVLPEKILEAIGIETKVIDPYDVKGSIEAMKWLLSSKGPKAVVARRECSLQAIRRGIKGTAMIIKDKCVGCRLCLSKTACMALKFNEKEKKMEIIKELCNGCGLCAYICPFDAIEVKKP
ncbi:MAG: 4Fe-4S binding protein [Euryarchaeota archaeon]|nr:4Fe-4S binding protein [Euryarchaeota archaeon]